MSTESPVPIVQEEVDPTDIELIGWLKSRITLPK